MWSLHLYHYTDKKGYDGIQSSGMIQKNKGKYGEFVYLTDLDPTTDNNTLAKTLFENGAEQKIQQGRLDHHFELKIPENEVSCVRPSVYVYDGDLQVRKYDVISQGLNADWTNVLIGTVGTAAAIKAAEVLYTAVDGRQQRLEQLVLQLRNVMSNSSNGSDFAIEHVAGWDVCLKCKICSTRMTEVYESGILWASAIFPSQVLGLLNEHHALHKDLEERFYKLCRQMKLPPKAFAIEWSASSSPTRVTGSIRCGRCDAFARTLSEVSRLSDDLLLSFYFDLLWHEFYYHNTWCHYMLAAALCIPIACVVFWLQTS